MNALFIGDSNSYGKFGGEVDTYLRMVSQNVTSMASCGSSPSTWMAQDSKFKSTNCGYWRKDLKGQETRVKEHKIDSFPSEMGKLHPDLTVIALGTNVLASTGNIESELKSIRSMLDVVKKSHSECIWVGPPALGKNPFKANLAQGVVKIKDAVEKAGCAYIDSSKLTTYAQGKGDGIHYGPKDSAKWGRDVVGQMQKLPQVIRAREKQNSFVPENKGKDAGGPGIQ